MRVLAFAQREFDPATFDPRADTDGADAGPRDDGARRRGRPAARGGEGRRSPPRRGAGIRVRMITGDHAVTAAAIAAELGIEGRAVTGAEFGAMSDEEADRQVDEIGVFARVAPGAQGPPRRGAEAEGQHRRHDRGRRQRRPRHRRRRHRHRHGHHRHRRRQGRGQDDPDRRQLRDDRRGRRAGPHRLRQPAEVHPHPDRQPVHVHPGVRRARASSRSPARRSSARCRCSGSTWRSSPRSAACSAWTWRRPGSWPAGRGRSTSRSSHAR